MSKPVTGVHVNVLAVTLLLVFLAMISIASTLGKRIEALEMICHKACQYGDKDCEQRCAAEGHCPFQD